MEDREMTEEKAIKGLKETLCSLCDCVSQNMDNCDIKECDNRDYIKALEQQSTTQQILSLIETGITATGQSDSYSVGFCNALVWLKSCITHEEPQFFKDKRGTENE